MEEKKLSKEAIFSKLEVANDGKLGTKDIITVLSRCEGSAVDRKEYLQSVFEGRLEQETIDRAIETNPLEAGVPTELVNNLADELISDAKKQITTKKALENSLGKIDKSEKVLKNAAAFMGELSQNIYKREAQRLILKLLYLYGFPEMEISERGTIVNNKDRFCMFITASAMLGIENADEALKAIAAVISDVDEEKFTEEFMKSDDFGKMFKKWRKRLVEVQAVFKVADTNPILGKIARAGSFLLKAEKSCKKLKKILADTAISNKDHEAGELEKQYIDKLMTGM